MLPKILMNLVRVLSDKAFKRLFAVRAS